jgi:hypothetical protein
LVLTAAHCAANSSAARVVAPDASGQSSSVRIVEVLDWDYGATALANRQRHDIAMLHLAEPIRIALYAKVARGFCGGCSVVQVGRAGGGAAIQQGAPIVLPKNRSAAHPYAFAVAPSPLGPGGAFVRRDAKGQAFVSGVMASIPPVMRTSP